MGFHVVVVREPLTTDITLELLISIIRLLSIDIAEIYLGISLLYSGTSQWLGQRLDFRSHKIVCFYVFRVFYRVLKYNSTDLARESSVSMLY